MKIKFVITVLLFFLSVGFLNAKKPVTIRCTNSNDSCKYETNIWVMDLNNDDKYDECCLTYYEVCKNGVGVITSITPLQSYGTGLCAGTPCEQVCP